MSKIPVGELMTIPEACEHLKATRQTIYRAIERGVLTAVPVLGGQRLLRSQVENYQPNGFHGKRPSKNAPPAGVPRRGRGRPPKATVDESKTTHEVKGNEAGTKSDAATASQQTETVAQEDLIKRI